MVKENKKQPFEQNKFQKAVFLFLLLLDMLLLATYLKEIVKCFFRKNFFFKILKKHLQISEKKCIIL